MKVLDDRGHQEEETFSASRAFAVAIVFTYASILENPGTHERPLLEMSHDH